MLNRRGFIAAATGLSSLATIEGLPTSASRSMSYQALDVLGHPPSSALIVNGCHPIAPERVILETESTMLDERRQKLDVSLRLMKQLTAHYRVSHLARRWATCLASKVEPCQGGFSLLRQFQDGSMIEPYNRTVDWWLVLFPQGAKWGTTELAFGMICHIFPPPPFDLLGVKLRAWDLATRVGASIVSLTGGDTWSDLARMDRSIAAHAVNRAISAALPSVIRPLQE